MKLLEENRRKGIWTLGLARIFWRRPQKHRTQKQKKPMELHQTRKLLTAIKQLSQGRDKLERERDYVQVVHPIRC
jgi:hypothetical protein